MTETEKKLTITMEKTGKMQFTTRFDKDYPKFIFDEPEHSLGDDEHPNASRMLLAASMNCLSASLTFCLMKSRIEVIGMKTTGSLYIKRNEEGRWRINKIEVEIYPEIEQTENAKKRLLRCKDIFKNYCTVSKSIEEGITVHTTVKVTDE